jgi:hypothetical protein
MFCIVAFVVFALLGVFSARYRTIARKAWGCVLRRVTFKPCDISIQEEIKSRLMGRFIVTHPAIARYINRWSNIFAWIFVILSVWSLVIVFNSGLNLFVYGTCSVDNPESCSLGGEGCGVSSGKPGFWWSLKEGHILSWAVGEVVTVGETISRVPARLKKWDAVEYVSQSSTYYQPFDASKSVALEIIDPSCRFCAKLFATIKETSFADRYNLTYVVYPIPDMGQGNGYRFPHSYLIASYLEALKQNPLQDSLVPSDWMILEKIFMGKDKEGVPYQSLFNTVYSAAEAELHILAWIAGLGYSPNQVERIKDVASSAQVIESLARQKDIVEKEVRTIKIPTILFDGRRYDRAVGPDVLR